jgi:hypothetical protein
MVDAELDEARGQAEEADARPDVEEGLRLVVRLARNGELSSTA